ncbi:MAG: RibD family protein [Solirubrobacterales bacterium]
MNDEIQPLGPDGPAEGPAEILAAEGIAPGETQALPDGRPRVMGVMVASADGRAVVEGHAGGLSSPADRTHYRSLRTACDACLVGPSTLVIESYSTLLDPHQRELREGLGLPPEPLLVTISRRLDPELAGLRIFNIPGRPVRVYTESGDDLPPCEGEVEVVRFAAGELTPAAVVEDLAELGVASLLCEGGPHLLGAMFEGALVSDLFLTVSPQVVGGEAMAIVEGPAFDPPVQMELRSVGRGGGHLFLHYAIGS